MGNSAEGPRTLREFGPREVPPREVAMYECIYCGREFFNVLWKTADNRPVCINCAALEKKEAVFSPDDREVPKKSGS